MIEIHLPFQLCFCQLFVITASSSAFIYTFHACTHDRDATYIYMYIYIYLLNSNLSKVWGTVKDKKSLGLQSVRSQESVVIQ